VQLTDSGRDLLATILPVWDAILLAMDDVLADEPACRELLPSIGALENEFRSVNLADRISSKLSLELKPASHE
jgi:hypothetical protein